ncbi:hypothetical protein [Streptomyces sp. NPDC102282]
MALFTVARERDFFTALWCVAALTVWQALYGLTLHGKSATDWKSL